MDVTFGTDFGAVAVLLVGAAASVGATGRFAVVAGTDVGFTAGVGRAAFDAVAEPATRAGAAAVPAAGATEPVLSGVGLVFVVAAAARGAPLAARGCEGAGLGVVAEEGADEVADVVADAVAADAIGLRGMEVALGGDATGADDEAGAFAAGAYAGFDAEADAEDDASAVV